MKVRLIVFSGMVTGLIGMMVGLAATKIGQPDFNRLKYSSDLYSNIYKNFIWIGAGVGVSIGVAQECLRELKQERDEEEENINK
jgi:hypothetical protein